MSFVNFTTPLVSPWDDIHVKHTWSSVPPSWETLGSPPSNTTIDLHIALVAQYENALIDALYEVSIPGNPKHVLSINPPRTMMDLDVPLLRCRYGAHLSKEQVAQLVAPDPTTLRLINSWLEHHHIPPSSISMTHGGSWLTVTSAPMSRANEMLGASYQLFRPSGTNGTTVLRTIGYGLPAGLHKHVRTVVPTTCFASTDPLWQTFSGKALRRCKTALSNRSIVKEIFPSDLRSPYRKAAYLPAATDKNELGVSGFDGKYPNPVDLAEFMSQCRADAIDATFGVVRINGGVYDLIHPSTEANQNMQYAQAIAYPIPDTLYNIGGEMSAQRGSNEPASEDTFLTWINYTINLKTIPQTISASYGRYENILLVEYTTALCLLFAQLGARGVSVLFPSGNTGVGPGDCNANEGSGVQFVPEFPSTCMSIVLFLLRCGWYNTPGTLQDPEVAAPLSGGGFSNHFPRPIYQNPAVPKFLWQLGNGYNGLYNADGRGIPDISAQVLRYYLISNQREFLSSGTSNATPTVAGIISLLNDYLLSKGKKPLGFLNPWLYGLGVVGMNDIKSGSNPGCGTEAFSAIAGWVPMAGLGTPDFLNLQDIIDYMNQFS
ncbi:subtilisin-like protein [Lactarius quietus]|nr:subtilisin-like protein [Lactarius quietus]